MQRGNILQNAWDHESETLRVFMCVILDVVSISLDFSLPNCEVEANFFHTSHTNLWSELRVLKWVRMYFLICTSCEITFVM